ncbi:hypothetical protein BDP27DRAFT_1326774 [Rhodocollybia butyracea]|uniref:Uncharacterized protein n=1 Tax=Rhodocollybia butyracea TaxID=206335 RepID=A0A9P5PRG5_9AGAR|nr:hypothetical protein BDP27DRAFT_1326774 [Rhodocollybia butyracea]
MPQNLKRNMEEGCDEESRKRARNSEPYRRINNLRQFVRSLDSLRSRKHDDDEIIPASEDDSGPITNTSRSPALSLQKSESEKDEQVVPDSDPLSYLSILAVHRTPPPRSIFPSFGKPNRDNRKVDLADIPSPASSEFSQLAYHGSSSSPSSVFPIFNQSSPSLNILAPTRPSTPRPVVSQMSLPSIAVLRSTSSSPAKCTIQLRSKSSQIPPSLSSPLRLYSTNSKFLKTSSSLRPCTNTEFERSINQPQATSTPVPIASIQNPEAHRNVMASTTFDTHKRTSVLPQTSHSVDVPALILFNTPDVISASTRDSELANIQPPTSTDLRTSSAGLISIPAGDGKSSAVPAINSIASPNQETSSSSSSRTEFRDQMLSTNNSLDSIPTFSSLSDEDLPPHLGLSLPEFESGLEPTAVSKSSTAPTAVSPSATVSVHDGNSITHLVDPSLVAHSSRITANGTTASALVLVCDYLFSLIHTGFSKVSTRLDHIDYTEISVISAVAYDAAEVLKVLRLLGPTL